MTRGFHVVTYTTRKNTKLSKITVCQSLGEEYFPNQVKTTSYAALLPSAYQIQVIWVSRIRPTG